MEVENIVISIFLLCIGASFIQRTTGFGFGIFIMTMLPFLMPSYGEATTLSGLLAMTTSLIVALKMRKYLVWKNLLPMLIVFLLISTPAIFLLKKMEGHLLKEILGITLIIVSLYFAFVASKFKLKQNIRTQLGAGTLSGLMGGFFGMQGPPAVLYFITSEPDKKHYMATAQTYFLMGNLAMTLVRAKNGFLTPTVGIDYLYGIGGVAIGTFLGAFVFKKIPARIFRYIVYCYIGISGIIILITS